MPAADRGSNSSCRPSSSLTPANAALCSTDITPASAKVPTARRRSSMRSISSVSAASASLSRASFAGWLSPAGNGALALMNAVPPGDGRHDHSKAASNSDSSQYGSARCHHPTGPADLSGIDSVSRRPVPTNQSRRE